MKKILVCCNTGVSTSLLVSKMRQHAEGYAANVEIEAEPLSKAIEHLSDADVILLGPQIGFAKAQIEQASTTPVAIIDSEDYANADAPKILAEALKLMA